MGCPGFVPRKCSQSVKGLWLFDVRLSYDTETKQVSVAQVFWSLKHLWMEGGASFNPLKSSQTFAFNSEEDYLRFATSSNFTDNHEWFKALIPFSFAHHQFGEPLDGYLARVSTL